MNMHAGPVQGQETVPSSTRGEVPIRSSFQHQGDLRALGRAVAEGGSALVVGVKNFDPRQRTKENAGHIREVAQTLARAQQAGEQLTPAANWLLDNSHVVEAAIAGIRRDLPPRFYQELPELEGAGIPRVLAIAWAYVAHTDSAISLEGFREIVEGFQDVQPLRIGELWALPSILRFVLVENLRRLALRVAGARDMRLAANALADQIAVLPAEHSTQVLNNHRQYAKDRVFATQLLFRLRDGSVSSGAALGWLENELEASGTDAEEATLAEHANLSAGNVTTGNIIKGLRLIDDIDWTDWFETVSSVDRLLREHTDFDALDFQSRDAYRRAIEELAKRSGKDEATITRAALDFAGEKNVDVGSVLAGPDLEEFEQRVGYQPPLSLKFYRAYRRIGWLGMVAPVAIITLVLLAATAWALTSAGFSSGTTTLLVLLFALPASEAAMGLFNTIVSTFVKPTRLIGYEYKQGVPAEARTLVAVPTMFGSRDDVDEAVRDLEVHYLANMTGELHFAILSDWPDSDDEQSPADKALLEHAQNQMAALNARYPKEGYDRFYLLHRKRLYNPSEGCWMGWERKRGKLHELNAMLRGDKDTTFFPPASPLPSDVVHVMTLDSDTRMTRDAVAKLVGKMMHPLNRPVIDPKLKRVVTGYGIMQPRVTASLTSGEESSFFQRVFSANRGIDPYVFAVSDTYQDLFGEGTFTGKGLYHIDAMETALDGRIPENAILSHDLIEGAFARAALVTDVEVIEDYPTRYLVDAARHHRWVRGDWQLLPWIFNPASGISGLSRWKMIDNLRRSLLPILWVAASIAGWTVLPFTQAAQWQALLILSLFLSATYHIVDSLVPRDTESRIKAHFASLGRDISFSSALVASKIILMAHQASSYADAIVRTLYRLFVSRKQLLEWRTASSVARSASGKGLIGHYFQMSGAVPVALIAAVIPLLGGTTGAWIAAFFALMWVGSPAFAWFVSQSAETEDRLVVQPDDKAFLRDAARRTWLYFETFVTEEHNMLPPDNFQEVPQPVVAARTSPTNIGMYLLSTVAARDFGWISLNETADRLDRTLATMEKMERYRGHLFNWYETRTLKPLHPLYISSVDSGNLAGHLIAVAAACDAWTHALAAHLQGDFEGIIDVTRILEEKLERLPDDRRLLRPLRHRLAERIEGMRRAVNTIRSEPETAAIRTINLTVLAADIVRLARGLDEEIGSPASQELSLWAGKLEKVCEAHLNDSHTAGNGTPRLREKLASLRDRARQFAFEMDFSFLLREDRKLLSIGYRVEERQLDEACYDLLASEARLTSLFGIAKGDLPTEHWFRLGRPVTEIGFSGALLSWSGSMFEYLMPPLVMQEPAGGLLTQSNRLIVAKQMSYARSRGVPWGISEAAYHARDREMTYQYTNFGVPGLGLKRGLAQDLVIAPYASLLAAQFRPDDAVANLKRLKALGAMGRYGYYDAVDFTPERVPEGHRRAVVRNYFAHHHGMSIVAVDNVVFEGRMRERFHSDPVIKAAELLLQEKAPRDVPEMPIRADTAERIKPALVDERPDSRTIIDPINAQPAVGLLSNGHYHVMVTSTGAGYSRADEVAVTRWNGDALEEQTGTFLFISDPDTGEWWSATPAPKRIDGENCVTTFHDDKAVFMKSVGTLRSEVECIAVQEGNGEARRLTLFNESDRDRHVEITSFAELALNFDAADNAHPAFSKMFVRTEIDHATSTIFAERQRRSNSDPTIALAHFVTSVEGVAREVEAETDRRNFIGRGRSIVNAAAFDPGARLTGAAGYTLDPIVALRAKVRVPARRKVALTFWTITAANRTDIGREILRFRQPDSYQRQAMLAWTRSQVQTRHVGLSLAEAAGVQKLARHLLFADPTLRATADNIASGLGSQSNLWPMAISGDFPIFALRISELADLNIVASALRMQEYLRAHGVVVDLVIVNEQASSYVQDLQQAIEQLCENARLRGRELGPRQHIFAVRRDLMDDWSYKTLIAAARVVMHTRNGQILDQIERAGQNARLMAPARVPAIVRAAKLPQRASGDDLAFWNGFGGFADDGREYVVRLSGNQTTPQPWINVIANREFGFHTSADGSSFTWSRNSRDFQLTPWSNDPVTDRPGEAIYIHDLKSGEAFSPLACVLRDPALVCEARHARGMSRFSVHRGGLATELTQLVDPTDPVKVQRLTIRNTGSSPAKLRVYAYAEWVMGTNRAKSAPLIVPGHDSGTGTVIARNPYHLDFGDRVAFLATNGKDQRFTCDRAEFIGAGGSSRMPAAPLAGAELSGAVEAGSDSCAALSCDVEVPAGGTASVMFVLGDAGSQEEAVALAQRHLGVDFDERVSANRDAWEQFSSALQVETPDPAFNAMVNVWLPYQALACRLRARSAFYQASGAFGFRDQLQDTLGLLLYDPSLAREQILNAASRQFPEGDVQHWWLPRTGAGVRTMISDDVVWLAHATQHYIKTTGDRAILDEDIRFIEGQQLKEGQHDAFFTPEPSAESASLYEHCARALDLAVKRTGENGLPLILGGDWNDGMDRVGEAGKGTSVWLGWFLLKTLRDFAPIAAERGDKARADAWEAHAGRLKQALEDAGWDGEWYRRGYFDDGSPLGSKEADECMIDSIAQSWAVISGEADPERAEKAVGKAVELLVDGELRIAKLFTPPFENTDKEPGYIKRYPPGVRENGGQYTHAATWLVIALARLGRADEAWRVFEMLNPVSHALTPEEAERYRVEPYVVAADVYSVGDKAGRGGWTWYTGSAGWLHRAAVEGILGIERRGDELTINPSMPASWEGFSVRLRIADAVYRITVRKGEEPHIEVNKHAVETIRLEKSGVHEAIVTSAG
ncbi:MULTISPECIES: glucoamylase family protein [unclassified Aminobacter]|uniref:GH36-type glycosyl hydrolase domain-containing protein n=1 Tax=unclassified Aminobacter TaxID=2644704 RepID=UPI000464AA9D|nr:MULTISPECIES: glucoamylase family protein [unclassified Aminobacter]TWH30752.1 cyclic beta-1,2-glucan synthetase [Aminobacter sp. J15]